MASDTRRQILDTALRLFNERGLHNVGVREIARELNISPGNLAYHFPRKDVLVIALVKELHAANNQQASGVRGESASLLTLYRSLVGVMRNHLAYRFYLVSYVDVLRHSIELKTTEASLSKRRRTRTHAALRAIIQSGYLDAEKLEGRLDRLHETLSILMTSWLRAVEIEMQGRTDEEAIAHYAKLYLALFEPYCTRKGTREIQDILAGFYDAEAFGWAVKGS